MNYLHNKYKTYEEGLEDFKDWRRGFFPDWDERDEQAAERTFAEIWNREDFDGGMIY